MKKVLLIAAAVLVAGLGLRVWGGFQNEERGALIRAAQAEERAGREQQLADRDTAELDCSQVWSMYRIAQQDVEEVRITEGQGLAYFRAEMEADKLKPVCDSEFTFEGSTHVSLDRLAHDSAVLFSRALAASERKYAGDRSMQVFRIGHTMWATLTGATLERPEEWTKFLAQRYDGVLGNLVLGTPLDPAGAAETQKQIQKTLQKNREIREKTQREIGEIRQRIQQAARNSRRR
jgi:hypothetical protein